MRLSPHGFAGPNAVSNLPEPREGEGIVQYCLGSEIAPWSIDRAELRRPI